mmetsp:Transcript_36251/g.114383  ORF Transcript_36251/g.114383 Transcript_36251/m.114383 type:complete len:261 (+) Transcript_36251:147-929(+)
MCAGISPRAAAAARGFISWITACRASASRTLSTPAAASALRPLSCAAACAGSLRDISSASWCAARMPSTPSAIAAFMLTNPLSIFQSCLDMRRPRWSFPGGSVSSPCTNPAARPSGPAALIDASSSAPAEPSDPRAPRKASICPSSTCPAMALSTFAAPSSPIRRRRAAAPSMSPESIRALTIAARSASLRQLTRLLATSSSSAKTAIAASLGSIFPRTSAASSIPVALMKPRRAAAASSALPSSSRYSRMCAASEDSTS